MNKISTKNRLIILIAASTFLLALAFLLFIANTHKKSMEISLQNLKVGQSSESDKVGLALPNEYKLAANNQAEPDAVAEIKAVDLAKEVTDAIFNKKDQSVDEIQTKYFEPIDKKKLSDDDTYILSPEFTDRMTRGLHFWAPPCVARNQNASLTKPIDLTVSFSSKSKYIVKVLLDDVHVTIDNPQYEDLNCSLPPSSPSAVEYKVDLIYEYTITKNEKTGKLQVYDLTMQAMQDLEEYRSYVSTVEKSEFNTGRQLTSLNKYVPSNAAGYNYNKVKNIDRAKVSNVFNDNSPKTVTITASGRDGIGAASGYGFIIRKGIVATSWKVTQGLLKDSIDTRYAIGFDGNLHKIIGVVSASPELDIAFLKLEEEFGEQVKFGDPTKLKTEDPVIVIGSPMGLTPITRVGIFGQFVNDGIPTIRNSLPLGDGDMGSPLFNLDGEVIGLNTSVGGQKTDGDTSIARPVTLFTDLAQKLKGQKFEDIKNTSFKDLAAKINTNKTDQPSTKISQTGGLWDKYKKLPDITAYKSLKIMESHSTGGYLSVRYENTISDFMKTSVITDAYCQKLKSAGFKLAYRNKNRSTYTKGSETVRIAERYNYLSIIYGVKK